MPNQPEFDEKLVLAQLRAGDEKAFEEIFKRYWHSMYTIARSKVQSHEDAEEIIQAIFVNLWEKRKSLLITNLSFYLQAAVRNRLINIVRSKITQELYWDHYKIFIPSYKATTEEIVEFEDLNEAVNDAVNRLPAKSRMVFKLSRMEGRSITEIASRLKLSEKAIEYHLTKSIKALRVHLKDFILSFFIFLMI